ncbi:MAG: hypothetical protein AMJ58_02500 [Gammaproteobacteria bacterium SG8_30]|nr:MAG: hypothetical protein AMJ58_02500 [Gammaproteobacteria bacterium SG8_30]
MFAVLSDPAIYEFENEPPASEQWLHRRYELLESRCSSDGSAYELNSEYWRRGIGSAAVQAMLHELGTQYEVERYVAVLKASNFRSLGLLRRLGFGSADESEAAAWRDTPDELVMVKAARRIADAP